MEIPTINLYTGVNPDRRTQSAEDFTSAAISWTDYQSSTLVPSINDTATKMNTAVTQVSSDAVTAQNAADAAQAAGNYQGVWTAGASVLKGQTWSYNGFIWVANNDGAGQPQVGADWILLTSDQAYKATKAILKGLGYSGNYGFFANGFDYVQTGDLGFDTNNDAYIYIGAGAPAKTVIAGTDPSVDPDYELADFLTASKITNGNGGSAQDHFDSSVGSHSSKFINWDDNYITSAENAAGLKQDTLKEKVGSMIANSNARIAVLGDSTEAGVGNGSDSAYGECRSALNGSHLTMMYFDAIASDSKFAALSNVSFPLSAPFSGTLPIANIPTWQAIGSNNPTITQTIEYGGEDDVTHFTIYIIERTSAAAPTFDVTLSSYPANITKTVSIDTNVATVDFGTVTGNNVNGRLVARTFTWTAGNRFDVKIDNFTGGAGTAIICGFAVNQGVNLKNFSVSSSTLENASAINITRGITTTERIGAAVSWGANCFFLGWGTNDSKSGGLSLPDFYTEYNSALDQIFSAVPNATVVLCTDPAGSGIYVNNVEYNKVIRAIARNRSLDLFDVEKLAESVDGFYADDVHPALTGYKSLSKSLLDSITPSGSSSVSTYTKNKGIVSVDITGGLSNTTGSFVGVANFDVARPEGKSDFIIEVNLSYYQANGDLEQSEVQIKVNGNVIKTLRYNLLIGSATALWDFKTISVPYATNLAETYNVSIELKNYSLRNVGGASYVALRWF